MTDAELIPYAYVLAVRDLTGISAYFREVLGFTLEWTDGDRWRALRRGQVRINPGRCPDALPPAELGDHNDFGLLITQDVDDLHREFATTGAIIRRSPPISHGNFGRWVWPPRRPSHDVRAGHLMAARRQLARRKGAGEVRDKFMTRFLSLAGSLLVSTLWIGSAFADPVTPSWPPVGIQHGAIDPARIALAHKIFDVAGKNYIEILAPNASLGFRMSLSHVLNEQDEVRRKVLAESIDAVFARVRPWTENEVVATIAENFSVDQLKDILAFATTPTGKVLIERMPWIVSQSLGAEMFQMHEIIRDVENVYCAKVTCTPSERAVFANVNMRSAPID